MKPQSIAGSGAFRLSQKAEAQPPEGRENKNTKSARLFEPSKLYPDLWGLVWLIGAALVAAVVGLTIGLITV